MRPRVTSVGLILAPPPADAPCAAHIDRASLDALPAGPGVYIFRDRRLQPLYIGKSINIRSRVMAHLRTREEADMIRHSRRVDFQPTAGEIGALLLESHLIKQHQPAWNLLLKDAGEPVALWMTPGDAGPVVVGCSEVSGAAAGHLYGLFPSRGAARQAWEALVRRHRLCPALLGLEAATHGRACFARQIGRCDGACIGAESAQSHRRRLLAALQQMHAAVWPYDGPIGIVESDHRMRQVHVIDRWCYLGSLQGRQRKLPLPAGRRFDVDTYKILAGPLLGGTLAFGACEVRNRAVYYTG